MRPSFIRFFKHPFAHFAALGLALFLAHRALTGAPSGEPIVLGAEVLSQLEARHRQQTGRPPSPDELSGLVRAYVDEEILYREALARGLHEGDPIVRRRLAQQMQFIAEDLTPEPEPTEPELREYFRRHAERYGAEARFSFSHVFLKKGGDAATFEKRKAAIDVHLDEGRNASRVGDPFLHGSHFVAKTRARVDRLFGAEFGRSLDALEPGSSWSGPLASAYGLHWVRITERTAAAPPAFGSVRSRVARDWAEEQRATRLAEHMKRLRERYEVVVEGEGVAAGEQKQARR